jgi:hypothetical protein
MRALAILVAALFSGCISADANPEASDDQPEASTQTVDDMEGMQDHYWTLMHVEMFWGGVVASDPGTAMVLEDYSRGIAAEGDVDLVEASVEWDDPLGGALRACITRDNETVAEIDCVEGTSPLGFSWTGEAGFLAPGYYEIELSAPRGGLPAGATVQDGVLGVLEVSWILPVP